MKDELVDIVMNIHQFNQDLTTLNIKQAETIEEQKQEIERLNYKLQQKENIIKEVREYITSHESIDTIQQIETPENNIDLAKDTFVEMVRRYMIVHDKLLDILDKGE